MDVNEQTKLIFLGVDILNVSFNAIAPRDHDLNVDFKCEPKLFQPQDESDSFKIIMDIGLRDDRFFELSISAVGSFRLGANIDSELRRIFINTNAPAIMFPYVRSFISTLTANLGSVTGTLTIPTQFFSGDLEKIG